MQLQFIISRSGKWHSDRMNVSISEDNMRAITNVTSNLRMIGAKEEYASILASRYETQNTLTFGNFYSNWLEAEVDRLSGNNNTSNINRMDISLSSVASL